VETVKDWVEEAMKKTKDEFVADHPHPFLIGSGPKTQGGPRGAHTFRIDLNALNKALAEARSTSLVMPLKKRLTTFPSMISLGRTSNNDLVVDDAQISKFHASFRFRDGNVEVEDAGSANGTYLGGNALVKGTPQPLRRGDVIRFGGLSFELYDPAGAWGWLTGRK
jgi:hypothetical protein